MRKLQLLLSALILMISSATAQVTASDEAQKEMGKYNFTVDAGDLKWIKVYKIDETRDEIATRIKNNDMFFSVSNSTEDYIVGSFRGVEPLYKEAGYQLMTTAFIAGESYLSGDLIINLKDGGYRVVLKNIKVIMQQKNPLFNGEALVSGYLIKKRGDMRGVAEQVLDIYNYTFSEHFNIQSESKISKDLVW